MQEVVSSTSFMPKAIEAQVRKLQKYFCGLSIEIVGSENEGFVIPFSEAISTDYVKALNRTFLVLNKISEGKFINYYQGKFASENLRNTQEFTAELEKIKLIQKHKNCIVIPAEIVAFKGSSANEVLKKIKELYQFGLTTFQVAIILITHYDRLVGKEDLWISCAGDEIIPAGCESADFSDCPVIGFVKNKISFLAQPKTAKINIFGSAVGRYSA